MEPMLIFGLLGALGGLARALIGLNKSLRAGRSFVLWYFLFTVILATAIGALLGSLLGTSNIIALLAGYAGTDLLEGLAKGFDVMPRKIG